MNTRVNFTIGAVIAALLLTLLVFAATAEAKRYDVATGQPGGFNYGVGAAIAAELSAHNQEITFAPVPRGGSSTSVVAVNNGQHLYVPINSLEAQLAYDGKTLFDKPNPNLRVVARLIPVFLAVYVFDNSEFKTINDLEDAQWPGLFSGQKIGNISMELVRKNGGIQPTRTPVPVSNFNNAADLMLKGVVDFVVYPFGAVKIRQMHASRKLRVLDLDPSPEAQARTQEVWPGGKVADRDGSKVWAYDYFLVTHKDAPYDVVLHTLQVLESGGADALSARYKPMRTFDPDRMGEPLGTIPFHPAAEAFFNE